MLPKSRVKGEGAVSPLTWPQAGDRWMTNVNPSASFWGRAELVMTHTDSFAWLLRASLSVHSVVPLNQVLDLRDVRALAA